MEVALAKMPPEVRHLCQRVMDGAKLTALAAELGISRRQVNNLLAQAKQHLEDAGFDEV
jgi:DNA-directed RNA polymerase specialized sigma24 family protein